MGFRESLDGPGKPTGACWNQEGEPWERTDSGLLLCLEAFTRWTHCLHLHSYTYGEQGILAQQVTGTLLPSLGYLVVVFLLKPHEVDHLPKTKNKKGVPEQKECFRH